MTDEQTQAPPQHCSCHPDDNPPKPCPRKHALRDCRRAALYKETLSMIVAIKNRDQTSWERALLGYLMRVKDVIEE